MLEVSTYSKEPAANPEGGSAAPEKKGG
jgi:hypothetical protein